MPTTKTSKKSSAKKTTAKKSATKTSAKKTSAKKSAVKRSSPKKVKRVSEESLPSSVDALQAQQTEVTPVVNANGVVTMNPQGDASLSTEAALSTVSDTPATSL